MSQPFVLQLSDNVDTINFLSRTYKVLDGGFDIGLPRIKRELVQERPGFYIPLISSYEYRECKLVFEIRGDTRTEVLASLHAVTKIIQSIHSRERLTAGRRGEIAYAWEGSTDVTYFEVFGGDLRFPSDILSVAKIHLKSDGQFVLPEIELTLYLSAMGYGVSIHSDTLEEIPLYNPSVASKQTGGVGIVNPWSGDTGYATPYWWVEIDGDDIPGDQAAITRIKLTSGASGDYSAFYSMYMGLQVSPYPTQLLFDDTDTANLAGGTPTSAATANDDRYVLFANPSTGIDPSVFSTLAWSLTNSSVGSFMALLHLYGSITHDKVSFAVGIDDYVSWGIQYMEEWIAPGSSSHAAVPLGSISIPPAGKSLADYGTLNDDLWLGLFMAADPGYSFGVDMMTLLPIGNGLRIWRTRLQSKTALTGQLIDDTWRGLQYINNAGTVATPFFALLDPLKLQPGYDQRIYFTSIGLQTGIPEFIRPFTVQVFAVPAYSTLAM